MSRSTRLAAIVIPMVLATGAGAQVALTLDRAVDVSVDPGREYVDRTFTAREPGILTVAVRKAGASPDDDLYLFVLGGEVARSSANMEELYFAMDRPDIVSTDEDLLGNMTAEQVAATIPAAGEYVVRVAAVQPTAFRMIATFLPFPEAASAIARPPDPVPLALGEPKMTDLEPSGAVVYEVTAAEAGLLTVLTRGSGDVQLSLAPAGDDDRLALFATLARSDNDQGGAGANESLAIEVEEGQRFHIRVDAYDTARFVTLAQLQPVSERLHALAARAAEGPPHPLLDLPLPELPLTDMEGKPVNLREIEARILVLDVWATWCGPCVRALPALERVHEWALKAGDPVAVRALNTGEPATQVRAFLEQHDLDLPVLLDPTGESGAILQARAIPMTIIVVDGFIDTVFTGLMPDHEKHLRSVIEAALSEF